MKNLQSLISLQGCSGRNVGQSAAKHGNDTTITPDKVSTTARLWLDYGSTTARVWKYAAMLVMLLTLGVGEMWGWSFNGDNYFYMVNVGGWSDSKIQMVIGKGTSSGYTSCYNDPTKITNTLLIYKKVTVNGWTDATYMGFMGNGSNWGGGEWGRNNITTNATHYALYTSGVDASNGQRYMLTPSTSSNTTTVTLAYLGNSGYSDLNKTVTIRAKVSTNGGSTYSDANTPGALSADSYKFSADATCGTSTSASLSAGSSTATLTTGYTANTSVSAASVTGYDFVGWYEGSTKVLNDRTGTMNPHGAVTLYAYYKVKQYTVSYGVNSSTRNGNITLNSDSAVTTTSSCTLNHGTAISFTATPSSGYQVEGWYSDAACSAVNRLQSGGTSYDAGTLTAAKTIYVKFEEKTGGVITLSAGTGGQVSKDGSSWGSSATITGITTTTAKNIYAQANSGYTFSSWSKTSGSGTIASTSSASTTFTPVAYEDATVTASFTETMHSVTINNGTGSSSVGIATAATVTCSNAAAGKKFKNWEVTGTYSITSGSLTSRTMSFTATTDVTVTATYEDRSKVRVYFTKPSSWTGTLKAYAWKSDDDSKKNGAWPGVTVSSTTTVNCETVYYYEYYTDNNGEGDNQSSNAAWNRIIFSDNGSGSNKTDDLTIANGHFYHWSSSGEGATQTSDWYVEGTFNSTDHWNTDDYPIIFDACGGSGSITIEDLTATAQTFKIYRYSTDKWYRYSTAAILLNTDLTLAISNDVVNNTFTPSATASYTFTLDVTDATNPVLKVAAVDATAHDATLVAGDNGSTSPADGAIVLQEVNPKTITAIPDEGYYFVNWTTDGDVTVASSTANPTSAWATDDGGTITANFAALDKIYFRNVFDNGTTVTHWANVYVYFDIDWDTYHTPSWGVWFNSDKTRIQMTQISGTDVYWAYVPRAFTVSASKKIAFSDTEFPSGKNFRSGNAVYRSDYYHLNNMFVPYHTKSSTQTYTDGSSYTTNYFSNGYWGKYDTEEDENVGYWLKNSAGSSDLAQFKAATTGGNLFEATYYINSVGNQSYRIVSGGGITYDASGTTITSSNATTEHAMRDNNAAFTITTTSEGNYTFRLSQANDTLKLSVIYPVSVGDYRVKHSYSDGGTKYAYSDVIKAADANPTVSMYYNPSSATMVLQKCTLVNASGAHWNTGTAITMTKLDKGKGVYKFNLTISADAATIDDGADLYDGPFYIKTDCAPGGWPNYKRNAMSENTINYNTSDPLKFNYYFCRWIANTTTNVKCVIANDYNNAISDTLVSDAILTRSAIEYETLPYAANVRFSYNSATNQLKRTYLLGSADANSFLYIVPNAAGYVYATDGSTDLNGSKRKFTDVGNWTYQMDVKAFPTAQAGVQTEYPTVEPITTQTLVPKTNVLIGGDAKGSTKYDIKLVYDFKTDYLMSAWVPTANIPDAIKDVDVMLLRHRQNAGTAITFNGGSLDAKKIIGAIQIDYNDMVGKVTAWNSTTRPLLKYFISFPFDVNVNDVFGLNSAYGDAYVIQKYNGAKRAEKGFFRGDGTTTFWEDLTLDSVMHANEGYCVILDNDYFNSNTYHLWDNKSTGSSIYLYFPSAGKVGTISSTSKTISIPAHECKIDRTFNNGSRELNHKNTDSHWNMMGVPIFDNHTGVATSGTPGAIFVTTGDTAVDCHYFYAWSSDDNYFRITAASGYVFKAMHSYFVQYTGNVTFTGSAPASVVARRASEPESHKLELQVLNGENDILNRAYIELRENACDTFALNEDVYMSSNNATANIYTFAGDYDVAANVLSIGNHTIPVGLEVRTAGTYAISMPSSFSGTATLIDTETGERTNLAISDYEVTLPKGVVDDRFLLEISDISNVITDIEYTTGEGSLKDGKPHKFVQNGLLYIVRDGVIYDAQGSRIK